ncbi:unnamed protein product [Adineta steineri]|uniref:Dihydrolipoyllysine-residue succinyltransferase component of 2-oxoglutarate dehydrogenase complex, mitochondrial n=1 Tax=Adineta steineri TaxID=433720 RepID=A0A813YGR5_9BILA|nr:unnamed protein product [Adineta steineri]
MSHIVSLRSASLRALRSGSSVAAASKCTTYPNRPCQNQQQYSFSTLPLSSNRVLITENNKSSSSSQRALSDQTLPTDSSHTSVYAFSRHIHTSSIVFDSVNVSTPSFPESVKDGTIRLLRKVGDKVSADETIAEIETDKSNLSVNSPQGGTIEEFLVQDGDNVTSGAPIAKLNTSSSGSSASKSASAEDKKDTSTDKIDAEKTKDTSTDKIDAEKTKDSSNKHDNEQTKEKSSESSSPTPKPPASLTPKEGSKRDTSAPPKPSTSTQQQQSMGGNDPNKISGTRSETRVKMTRMRLKIAERLKEAQNTCAMLTTFNEIDMSNIVEFRKKYSDQFLKRHNIKLGFMSAFVKASACALMDNPIVNAVIDGNEIVYRDYVDISVAVASPKGLVVPVLRNVEQMSFADIERAINEYGEKAKKGALAIEDMDGGTFTISNGGVFGSLFGTPLINLPQSAILGMHGIFDRPVSINGKIEIRPMMYVALTYDHRILDGRDAVLFLRKIKQYVEDSRSIFLNL